MNKKIIYIDQIKENLDYLMSFGKKLTIMVKANAYGHGVFYIAKALKDYDVKLGVATVEEAVLLRKYWKKEILIVEPIHDFEHVKNHNFQFVIDEIDDLVKAKKERMLERCYIKINTGMNRFGAKYDDLKFIKKAVKIIKKHKIKGIFTHFSCFENKKNTLLQYQRLKSVLGYFKNNGNISLGGSGILKTNFDFNEARIGIVFYGYENENVKPIMKVKSQILKVIEIKTGEMLGYGCDYIADGEKKIAIVGIGYGDGIRRDLKGFVVMVNGAKCNIVGNICMDCLFIDVTAQKCKQGDEVVLCSAKETADYLRTIPYEVLTSYSNLRGETIIE